MSYQNSMPKEDALAVALPAIYQSFSYRKYSMAKFEEYSFYSDNRKFLPDEGIIAFNNSDGRLMALKPDITLSIIKNARIAHEQTSRLFYNETVYRMSGDTHDCREIRQIGAEVLGEIDVYSQAELIYLALLSLQEIDRDFVLSVSHMGLITHFVDTLPLPVSQKKSLMRCVAGKSAHEIQKLCSLSGLPENIAHTLCAFSTLHGTLSDVLPQVRALCCDEIMHRAADELESLLAELSGSALTQNLCFDASVVNHIDYYNGLIFKGYVKNCPGPVLSGGRYDHLIRKIRQDACAIGFAVYLDGLNLYYPVHAEYDTDVLILCEEKTDGLLPQVCALVDSGRSVRVEKSAEGVRAKEVYHYKGGKLC